MSNLPRLKQYLLQSLHMLSNIKITATNFEEIKGKQLEIRKKLQYIDKYNTRKQKVL